MMTWEKLLKCSPGRIDELNDDAWIMINMVKTLKSVREYEENNDSKTKDQGK